MSCAEEAVEAQEETSKETASKFEKRLEFLVRMYEDGKDNQAEEEADEVSTVKGVETKLKM